MSNHAYESAAALRPRRNPATLLADLTSRHALVPDSSAAVLPDGLEVRHGAD